MGSAVSARRGPVATAEAFIHSIQWAEHTTIWELLSGDGRETALSVAVANGLDRVTAARIRDEVSDPRELDEFLSRLLAGLRRDLRSVDLDRLAADAEVSRRPDETAIVTLTNPSTIPNLGLWSAGELVLSQDDSGAWRVDRLLPRLAGP